MRFQLDTNDYENLKVEITEEDTNAIDLFPRTYKPQNPTL